MLKIGLTQRVEYLPDRGERRDCLDQAWTRLMLECGFLPVPLPNLADDVDGLLAELGISGVVLTGGNDLAHLPGATNAAPERDDCERRLLQSCADRAIPVLGVCRGMQMLVSFHGGAVVAVDNHVARPHTVTIVATSGHPLTNRDEVNSFHGFGVRADGVPEALRVVATAPDGTVEAVAHRRLPQWAMMWHPERSPRDPRDGAWIRALFGGHRP